MFPVFRWREILGQFFQITFIVRAVVVDAFMDAEVLAVFDRLEGMSAVRALESERGDHFFPGHKGLPADLALKLAAAAGVVVNILMGCAAKRAYGIRWDCTLPAFVRLDRFYGFAIAETIVFVPELPVLLDKRLDNRELIRKELLIFWTVKFIMSPLFERDISADKENKLADLAILFLNDIK